MKRSEIFEELEKIEDVANDFTKLLSNLHYTHFFLMDKYKKILSEYDLTSPQSNVLGIIDYFHPAPLALEQIKEMILEPNADVSRIVGRLADKDFVKKVINPENRRKVSIGMTPKGRKVITRIKNDKKFQRFTSMLSVTEGRKFAAILAKIRSGASD
jgi:DNA-binding MarR family transcriptional regulator